MSDSLQHECGIAFIRLRKPLSFYAEKYGSCLYAIHKLYLLMEKQHNRGQDGAGVVTMKLGTTPGDKYISRARSAETQAIQKVFQEINARYSAAVPPEMNNLENTDWIKAHAPFAGELLLGHLRYGAYGKRSAGSTQPFIRHSNWITRTLTIAGNFNLTNLDEIFQELIDLGQHPKQRSSSVTMLENVGHYIDEENRRLYRQYADSGLTPREIYSKIAEEMDLVRVLKQATKKWDGSYVVCGIVGHGDAFIARDPSGIRPAFYYENDEIVVVTSERPQLQTTFDAPIDQVKEIKPGHALIIKRNGSLIHQRIRDEAPRLSCSFERVYFSRGNDLDIYKERKQLGEQLVPQVLKAIDYDLENSVFSYIPNTAESCFYGMRHALSKYVTDQTLEELRKGKKADLEKLERLISFQLRTEKVALKDTKLRTFIAEEKRRDDLISHVYDVTYGSLRPGVDNLVVIDDSIVRGATLRQSILKALDRLGPKKIVVVSSAPQIRYPDCYGIDMAKLGEFVAFQAAIELLKEKQLGHIIDQTYNEAKAMLARPVEEMSNVVKAIYKPLTDEEITLKIGALLKPVNCSAEVEIIYQSIDGLHSACPDHLGDWYFSGDYPTPGGFRFVCECFVDYVEKWQKRKA